MSFYRDKYNIYNETVEKLINNKNIIYIDKYDNYEEADNVYKSRNNNYNKLESDINKEVDKITEKYYKILDQVEYDTNYQNKLLKKGKNRYTLKKIKNCKSFCNLWKDITKGKFLNWCLVTEISDSYFGYKIKFVLKNG